MTDALVALVQLGPSLANLATNLVSSTDEAKRNAQLIEFQKAIIGLNALVASVQQQNATLLNQKNDAEAELRRMKDWEAEKQRYKLSTPFAGIAVFALQRTMSNGEPAHYLCANCFQNGKQSHIANSTKDGFAVLACSACKFTAATRWRSVGPAKYAEEVGEPK